MLYRIDIKRCPPLLIEECHIWSLIDGESVVSPFEQGDSGSPRVVEQCSAIGVHGADVVHLHKCVHRKFPVAGEGGGLSSNEPEPFAMHLGELLWEWCEPI